MWASAQWSVELIFFVGVRQVVTWLLKVPRSTHLAQGCLGRGPRKDQFNMAAKPGGLRESIMERPGICFLCFRLNTDQVMRGLGRVPEQRHCEELGPGVPELRRLRENERRRAGRDRGQPGQCSNAPIITNRNNDPFVKASAGPSSSHCPSLSLSLQPHSWQSLCF